MTKPETGDARPGREAAGRTAPPPASLLAGALLLSLAAACGKRASPDLPLPERVGGCWALELEAGAAAADSPALSPGDLPSLIELDTVPAGSEADSAFLAHSYAGTRRRDHPFNRWRGVGEDSVRVYHSGALAGLILRAGVAGDTLMTGTARSFGDVMPAEGDGSGEAPFRGRPADCPGGDRAPDAG